MTSIKFYCPYYIELLFDFFGEFNIKTNEKYTSEKKKKVLSAISELLSNEIIFVGKIENDVINRWNFSNNEIIKKIDNLWMEETDYAEFYNMVWFGYENWYIEKMEKLGFKNENDWNIFVKTVIGDLELWIKENKPK